MDGFSLMSYLIFIADKDIKVNLIDYTSYKSRRVVRSVLGTESVGLTDACLSAIVIHHGLRPMVRKTLKLQVLTDSEMLFNVIITDASTTAKRLMIDVKAGREAYNEGIIDDVIWVRRKYNLADAMTKASILPEFVEALEKNKLYYEVEQSINRTIRLPIIRKEKDRV